MCRRWVLKCHACNKVTQEIGRIFCPKCGNGGTLRKVSVTVGENGIVLAARKQRFILRGTKVSPVFCISNACLLMFNLHESVSLSFIFLTSCISITMLKLHFYITKVGLIAKLMVLGLYLSFLIFDLNLPQPCTILKCIFS